MKSTGLWVLLALIAIQANARLVRRGDSEEVFGRARREVELHDWLTAEQKKELEPLKDKMDEYRAKVMEFYKQLPDEKQKEWNKFYKKRCVEWLKTVASEEERNELKQLKEKKDKETLLAKIRTYRARLPEDKRKTAEAFESECIDLWKDELSRKRRDIDKNFEEFTKWMTEEQKKEVSDLKASGKSFDELRKKTIEYFEALPKDKQDSLKEEFKGKCKAFFKKISTPEEMNKMKELHDSGNDDEVRSMVKDIISRLSGDEMKLAKKMEMLCTDVFAVKHKRRRDIDEKINRRLSWMTADQKEEIKQMHASGKSHADIRAKIFEYLSALEGPAGIAAKKQTQKECYKWMEDVATAEEIAALHEMHERDHDGCKKRVREFMTRLPADRKAEVEKNLPFCEKVWYGDHEHHGHHGHHHRRHLAARRRRHLHAIDKFLDWLTPEQKATLEEIEKSGSEFDNVIAKVKEYYNQLPEATKADLKANFKDQCSAWVKEVATPEEMEKIREMHKTKNHAELKKKLAELENRLTEEQKHTVEHVRDVCLGVWEVQNARRRREHHEHKMDEEMNKYLTWLTPEQKDKLKEKFEKEGREPGYKLVMEFFETSSGDVKAKAKEELKAACKHFGKEILGEENSKTLTEMKDSGASHEEMEKKVKEMVAAITDPEKRERAEKFTDGCKKIYKSSVSRRRRGQELYTLEKVLENYLTWLTDDQKAELKSLKEAGNKDEIYNKIVHYFDGTSGDTKKKALEEMQTGCKHYIRNVVGDEKADEFKQMRESGVPVDEIAKKIDAIVDGLTNEEVKTQAKKAAVICKAAFSAPKRFRRGQELYTLEKALEHYLTWLTDDQKNELKSLKESGDKDGIYKKVLEYYEAASGDVKKKATEDLQVGCKHYIRNVLGDEKADEFKHMRESGVSPDEIGKKIEALIEELDNAEVKAQAKKSAPICKKVFSAPKRFRREHHEHKMDEEMKKYLTWLTPDQHDKLKEKFEKEGREPGYKLVMEYFEASSGDVKAKATEELKAACKHFSKEILGEENTKALTELKESGASHDEMEKKVNEMVAGITDPKKKERAEKYAEGCKKIYKSSASRRRRGQELYTLEKVLENYLTWLTEDQKAELKSLKEAGNKDEIYKKIVQYFDGTSGDTKKKALEDIQTGCKHYIRNVVGDEKADEFKHMRESGVPVDEIAKKIDEIVDGLTNEEVKTQAKKAAVICKAAFSAPKRLRREHHGHTFEEAMQKYLTWLSDDEKIELKSIHEAGDKTAMYEKVMEMFDEADGEKKEKAVTELKGACRHFVKDLLGEENAEKLREMKESGSTNEMIATEVEEMIEAIADDEKKEKAMRASKYCKKVYNVARRMRRDHDDHKHDIEEAMQKYLTWLTDDQKAEVKKLHEKEGREAVYKKVMEWFDAASGETKEKAREELKDACKHYLKDHIGEEHAEKLKEMKESGASKEAMAAKVDELIAAIADEKKKEQAMKASAACKKIYGVTASRIRREHEHSEQELEEAMKKFLTWMDDEQKAELKKTLKEGDRLAAYKKVMEFFEGTSGEKKAKAAAELKAACKHYIKELIGEEKAARIRHLKESGATNEAIAQEVDAIISLIPNEKKREQARHAAQDCKKIFGVAKRMRREHHEHTLEEGFQKYLTWLNEGQKDELRKLDEKKDEEGIFKKIMEYYDGATGEVKGKATEELKEGCKHHITEYIGKEKADEMKKLKDSGTPDAEIAKKIDEAIDAITDEKVKAKAQKAASSCRKIYGITKARRHLAARRTRREFERRSFLFGFD